MDKIRWGILGCGDVTEVKSGPAFQNAVGCELTAVMRRTGSLAEDYARRHNVPKWHDQADALIDDPEVDLVYIATPPGSHLQYALRVCEAGKPAYVEKPMARNYEESITITKVFHEAKIPLYVAYYRRALPRFLKVKELIESGGLGTVTSITYRYAEPAQKEIESGNLPWRLRAEESGGGLFLDLGCHALDILDFIFGPLADVSGNASNVASPYNVEDSVAMNFRTSSGVLGTAWWNFAGHTIEDLIEITGTDGRISLSLFENEPVLLQSVKGDESFDLPNPKHIQQPFIQTIVDDLMGMGTCHSNGLTASRTARVMDTVLEKYYGARDIGFWNHPESWPGNMHK